MRTATPTLAAHLTTAKTTLAFDLWTVTLASGQVLLWTDADVDVAPGDGRVFTRGPIIERDKCRWTRGVQVDTLKMTLKASSTVLVAGQPLVQFAAAGGFTGALLQLERAFFDVGLVFKGSLLWFSGTVGDVDLSRYDVAISVFSDLHALDVQIPRNLYQASCLNQLYDVQCAVDRRAYAVATSASSVDAPTQRITLATAYAGRASGWFDLGSLRFATGLNAGLSRTVKSSTNSGASTTFVLARPLPFPMTVGDAFTVWPGCDHTQATCGSKFGNLARHRATPYVPDASTVA